MCRKLLLMAFLVGIISFCGMVFYLETSIDKVISKEWQQELYTTIKSSQLPIKFKQTIKKYHPEYFQQGVWASIFKQLVGKDRNQCQCREIYLSNLNYSFLFAPEIFALELEERFSQEACYQYNMRVSSFGFGQIGVENAAQFYFNTNIKQLTEREILTLDFIRKKPRFYNTDKGKQKMNATIDILLTE